MQALPTGGHLGTGAPLGRLNCAPSLNDSALERRAPCGSDRVLCLQHMFPAPLQGGPLRAEGERRPTNGKLTPGPSLTALLSRTHSPRSSVPAPAPACVPAPWLHRGPKVGQGTGCCRGRCWPQPAKWGLEMAPGLLSVCPSCPSRTQLWGGSFGLCPPGHLPAGCLLSPARPCMTTSASRGRAPGRGELSLWPAGQSCFTCLKTGERNLVFALSK